MGEREIVNRMPELRARHRLTQQALAAQVGVARQTIVAIEKGQYNPSLLLAFKIAHCLGEPLEAVFQFVPPQPVAQQAGGSTMPLYPSWIEIPVADLERALAFYRAVFGLDETPRYEDGLTQIAVLLASDKGSRAPGVSLVQSPAHTPGPHGVVVNLHLGDHAALAAAVQALEQHGGAVASPLVDEGDGQHYLTVRDSEGNTLALSSYEPPADA